MKEIVITTTGVCINDYSPKENIELEKHTSYFEKNRHKFMPVSGFYDEKDGKFLTYKMSESKLTSYFHKCVFIKPGVSKFNRIADVDLGDFQLRDNQKSVITRMTQIDQPEMFVNIPTATGKTVIGVYFIAFMKIVSLVVCPSATIMSQWTDTMKRMGFTNRYTILGSGDQLTDIIKGRVKYNSDIYLITPMLMTTYGNKHGFDRLGEIFEKLHIGMKFIDEAHKNLGAIVRLNAITSFYKTIYLSADFYRASSYTRKQFFDVFYHVPIIKMDQEEIEQLKHITAVVYPYHSKPSMVEAANVITQGKYHWSHWEFARYEFNKGIIIDYIDKILDKIISDDENSNNQPYKILILTIMVEHADLLYDHITQKYGHARSVGKFHSRMTDEARYTGKHQDIIVATYQAFSVGIDIVIPNIQHVISTSPVDVITHNQSAGRCRPIEGEESFYWILEDTDFDFCRHNVDSAMKYLAKSRVKNIVTIKEDD